MMPRCPELDLVPGGASFRRSGFEVACADGNGARSCAWSAAKVRRIAVWGDYAGERMQRRAARLLQAVLPCVIVTERRMIMEIHEHAGASAASTHFDTPSGQDLKRSGDVTRFTEVDLTPDARFFVDFMDHANAQPDRQRFRKIIAERLNISVGDRVLDVGCGTGDDVRMLASLVGPTGRVIGIDASKSMIDVAECASGELCCGQCLLAGFPGRRV